MRASSRWLYLLLAFVSIAMVRLPQAALAEGDCRGEVRFESSYYSGSMFGQGYGSLHYPTGDLGACIDQVQRLVLSFGGFLCAHEGIHFGSAGIAYVWFSWKLWWNDEDVTIGGPVLQQYDCGHISTLP
jgi:hypothetical protein